MCTNPILDFWILDWQNEISVDPAYNPKSKIQNRQAGVAKLERRRSADPLTIGSNPITRSNFIHRANADADYMVRALANLAGGRRSDPGHPSGM